jgi:hypothetical protein
MVEHRLRGTTWRRTRRTLEDASTGDLDGAWDDFESAVNALPDDASVQDAVTDVTSAADDLTSAAKSTASSINC